MTEQRVVILGWARVDEVRDPGGVHETVAGDAVQLATSLLGDGLVLTVVAPVADDADGERIRRALEDRGIRLVAVPAPDGTPRGSLVRDRAGARIESPGASASFSDTRRSLAAQAEADLIVDLRDREVSTLAEERADVLRALGLGAASGSTEPASAAVVRTLLPAPIVAGTYRHAPVRLIPEAPVAQGSAPDWHGLQARISRIAT